MDSQPGKARDGGKPVDKERDDSNFLQDPEAKQQFKDLIGHVTGAAALVKQLARKILDGSRKTPRG